MEKISMSNEDYLEAIIMLGGNVDTPVKSVDVARHMGVSKTSVNKSLTVLKDKGFVTQPYYGSITLTPSGFEYGTAVYKRHRYLVAFFTKGLGIADDVAEREACLMEHAISDESFDRWVDYVDRLGLVEETAS